jgi:CRISPR/Cas system-associated exonuclease Cas4 (RecB family)
MTDPIVNLYDAMDAKQLDRSGWGRPNAYYASNAYQCRRNLWYKYSGYRPAPGSSWLSMIAEAGNMGHDLIRRMLLDTGAEMRGVEVKEDGTVEETIAVRKTFDFPVEDVSFKVSIRPDGEILLKGLVDKYGGVADHSGWCALEIKTIDGHTSDYSSRAFKAGGHDGVLAYFKDRRAKYFDQMQLSMGMMGASMGALLIYDRSMGQAGYYNPKTGERLGFMIVPFDPVRFDQLIKKFKATALAVKAGEAPAPEYTRGHTMCKQCDFKYLCHDYEQRKRQGMEPHVLYPNAEITDVHVGYQGDKT